MELFSNAKRERLISIASNYVDEIIEDRGNNNIEDLASAFSNAGFTKSEFIQILDDIYLDSYHWVEEDTEEEEEAVEKVNTETGEGVFWKEYNEEDEDAEPEEKSTPTPDYFRFITMLDNAAVKYRNVDQYTIELYDDPYTSVEFQFNTDFKFVGVEW